jgi:hypothetical protein
MDKKIAIDLWRKISVCIEDEISTNKDFSDRIAALLNSDSTVDTHKKRSNRRTPAKVDPFQLIEESPEVLRNALNDLSVEELKDVIAANGMDAARLAMKWKNKDRLVEHIVDFTQRRSSRGEAFWSAGEDKRNP